MNRLVTIVLLWLLIPIAGKGQVDTIIGTHAGNAKDLHEMAHLLCDTLTAEKDKANAIYNWVTHNIEYDVKAFTKKQFTTDKKAEKAFRNRKALCEGYSMLFTEMCREAGLKAVNIEGYARDWTFDNGDSLYIPRHMWAAVMIDGKWWLTDPTWGAGGLVQAPGFWRRMMNKIMHQNVGYAKRLKFRYKYDPQYFMEDPEAFRFRHLPTDPVWQLTDTVMPMWYFEGGDSTVKEFNEKYSKPMQDDPQLVRISELDEKQKLFEFADRAYGYNNRFPVVLALKQTYRAESQVIKAFTDSTVQDGMLLIKDAEDGLRKSQTYIEEQKKGFPAAYSNLKKKNTRKSQETKKDMRQVNADNKKLITECKRYQRTAGGKQERLKAKENAAIKRMKGADEGKIMKQVAAKVQKKEGAPELAAIKDSVTARNERIGAIKIALTEKAEQIRIKQKENSDLLDSLATSMALTDSLLVQEAIARINMHDNYDDEVKALSAAYNNLKYHKADTLQKYYLIGFDSITAMHEQRQKMQVAEMELYKKNISSLEQYAKWNSKDTSVFAVYAGFVNGYKECIEFYTKDLEAYAAYVSGNRKLFAYLEKLGKRQVKISEYMVKIEDRRKKLEEKKIADSRAFDIKENARQLSAVKDLLAKLEKISAGVHD